MLSEDGLIEVTESDLHEAFAYIRNYFPPVEQFEQLAEEGGDGSEKWKVRMDGDDFAGWCWGMKLLMEYHGYNWRDPWGLDR